jgi:predicted GNAT family acetyltransferase
VVIARRWVELGYNIDMQREVRRNEQRGRYELTIDGRLVGIADFVADGSTVVLPHTEIDPAQRGHGLGAILVKGALDDIRARGGTVIPRCWYVRQYIDEHPEEADLLAA